ncbi:MAG: hypothetical protein AMJ79_07730 [Phycisphaerae bacterium SM23_30]|nr:MAG: hypothetical protein AMJ79_07730 [Phycisphaerae bacterium SM23_30]
MPREKLLSQNNAMLLVVDIQDAFMAHIPKIEQVIERSRIIIEAAKLLELPLVVTEQYPQGLGRTNDNVQKVLGDVKYHDKVAFSCMQDEAIKSAITRTHRRQVIIIGIETHVCISQTAHDLLAAGLQPHVMADAVASRRKIDHKTALRRMPYAGIIVSTTEAAVFELMVSSKHKVFREISNLVK